MDPKTVQRRRGLFWELFSNELFYVSPQLKNQLLSRIKNPANAYRQSFALGRPPSIRLSYVDCEFPDDDEATLDAQGNTLVGGM